MGHAIRTWSAVCSAAPHSQFGGARPHLCMDEWNHSKPVLKRLSLTQAAWDRRIPTSLAPVLGKKHGAWKNFRSTPHFIYDLSIQKRGCQVRQDCPKDSAQCPKNSGKIVQKILVSLGQHLRTHLKEHKRYDQGLEIHGGPRRVSLPVGETQVAGCLKI